MTDPTKESHWQDVADLRAERDKLREEANRWREQWRYEMKRNHDVEVALGARTILNKDGTPTDMVEDAVTAAERVVSDLAAARKALDEARGVVVPMEVVEAASRCFPSPVAEAGIMRDWILSLPAYPKPAAAEPEPDELQWLLRDAREALVDDGEGFCGPAGSLLRVVEALARRSGAK